MGSRRWSCDGNKLAAWDKPAVRRALVAVYVEHNPDKNTKENIDSILQVRERRLDQAHLVLSVFSVFSVSSFLNCSFAHSLSFRFLHSLSCLPLAQHFHEDPDLSHDDLFIKLYRKYGIQGKPPTFMRDGTATPPPPPGPPTPKTAVETATETKIPSQRTNKPQYRYNGTNTAPPAGPPPASIKGGEKRERPATPPDGPPAPPTGPRPPPPSRPAPPASIKGGEKRERPTTPPDGPPAPPTSPRPPPPSIHVAKAAVVERRRSQQLELESAAAARVISPTAVRQLSGVGEDSERTEGTLLREQMEGPSMGLKEDDAPLHPPKGKRLSVAEFMKERNEKQRLRHGTGSWAPPPTPSQVKEVAPVPTPPTTPDIQSTPIMPEGGKPAAPPPHMEDEARKKEEAKPKKMSLKERYVLIDISKKKRAQVEYVERCFLSRSCAPPPSLSLSLFHTHTLSLYIYIISALTPLTLSYSPSLSLPLSPPHSRSLPLSRPGTSNERRRRLRRSRHPAQGGWVRGGHP